MFHCIVRYTSYICNMLYFNIAFLKISTITKVIKVIVCVYIYIAFYYMYKCMILYY